MHLAFNVYRLSSLKHYAGLVEHALGRGIDVTLYCDHTGTETPRAGGKAYEFPWVEKLPPFRRGRPRVEAYRSLDDLAESLRRSGVNVLFSLYAKPLLYALRARGLPGLFLAQIQAGWDYLMGGTDLELFDVVYGFSAAWPGWWAAYLVHAGRLQPENREQALKQMEAAFVPVGFAEMEQLKYSDPAAARARLGLPTDRRVVALLPFPFDSVPREFWPHWIYGRGRPLQCLAVAMTGKWGYWPYVARGWNDRRLVRTLREFCDRQDALLVTKSREKNPVRPYVAALSDRVLYDEAYYPATILDLMLTADLAVHFYSSVLSEAVCAGVPNVCIAPTAEEWPAYGRRMVVPEFSDAADSFYNFPGVVWQRRVGEFIAGFRETRPETFMVDQARRRQFIEKFFGYDDLDVAERIVADLHSRFGL